MGNTLGLPFSYAKHKTPRVFAICDMKLHTSLVTLAKDHRESTESRGSMKPYVIQRVVSYQAGLILRATYYVKHCREHIKTLTIKEFTTGMRKQNTHL